MSRFVALLALPMLLPPAAHAIALFDLPGAALGLGFSSQARAGGVLDPSIYENWSWSSPPAGAFTPGLVYQQTHSGGGPGTDIQFSYATRFAAFGDFGRLGASASMQQVESNGEQSSTWAIASATATDAFLVESGTLPTGTAVTVNFDVAVNGVIQGELPEGGDYATAQLSVSRLIRVYRGTMGNLVAALSPQDFWSTYGTGEAIQVNERLPLALTLQVGDAVAFDISFGALAYSAYNGGFYGADREISAHADAMHTLGMTIAPSDGADVQLQFVSGHDYAPAAIPEPPGWALCLGGLVAMGGALSRRRRARESRHREPPR